MRKFLTSTLLFSLIFVSSGTATAAVTMKPGLWEITSNNQMAGLQMPAIPPEQMAKMKAMGIQMPTMDGLGMQMTVRHCISKEQAEKGVPPQPKDDGQCQQNSVVRSGNKVSWSVECTGRNAASGTGWVTLLFPVRKVTAANQTSRSSRGQTGPMTMKQQFSGKWLSASCEGK